MGRERKNGIFSFPTHVFGCFLVRGMISAERSMRKKTTKEGVNHNCKSKGKSSIFRLPKPSIGRAPLYIRLEYGPQFHLKIMAQQNACIRGKYD